MPLVLTPLCPAHLLLNIDLVLWKLLKTQVLEHGLFPL